MVFKFIMLLHKEEFNLFGTPLYQNEHYQFEIGTEVSTNKQVGLFSFAKSNVPDNYFADKEKYFKLKHPSTVMLQGYFETDLNVYLVLERFPSCASFTYFMASIYDIPMYNSIIPYSLASYLKFLHSKNLVHGTLDPTTMFYDSVDNMIYYFGAGMSELFTGKSCHDVADDDQQFITILQKCNPIFRDLNTFTVDQVLSEDIYVEIQNHDDFIKKFKKYNGGKIAKEEKKMKVRGPPPIFYDIKPFALNAFEYTNGIKIVTEGYEINENVSISKFGKTYYGLGIKGLKNPKQYFGEHPKIFNLIHPHLMTQLGFMQHEGSIFILAKREHKYNWSLAEYMPPVFQYDDKSKNEFFYTIAGAISFLHKLGIVHGAISWKTIYEYDVNENGIEGKKYKLWGYGMGEAINNGKKPTIEDDIKQFTKLCHEGFLLTNMSRIDPSELISDRKLVSVSPKIRDVIENYDPSPEMIEQFNSALAYNAELIKVADDNPYCIDATLLNSDYDNRDKVTENIYLTVRKNKLQPKQKGKYYEIDVSKMTDYDNYFELRKSIFGIKFPGIITQLGYTILNNQLIICTDRVFDDNKKLVKFNLSDITNDNEYKETRQSSKVDKKATHSKSYEIIFRIANAVACLHKYGIVHGYLNVKNLFWHNGKVKLFGYGISSFEGMGDKTIADDDFDFTMLCRSICPQVFGGEYKLIVPEDVAYMKYPLLISEELKSKFKNALKKIDKDVIEIKKKLPNDSFLKDAGNRMTEEEFEKRMDKNDRNCIEWENLASSTNNKVITDDIYLYDCVPRFEPRKNVALIHIRETSKETADKYIRSHRIIFSIPHHPYLIHSKWWTNGYFGVYIVTSDEIRSPITECIRFFDGKEKNGDNFDNDFPIVSVAHALHFLHMYGIPHGRIFPEYTSIDPEGLHGMLFGAALMTSTILDDEIKFTDLCKKVEPFKYNKYKHIRPGDFFNGKIETKVPKEIIADLNKYLPTPEQVQEFQSQFPDFKFDKISEEELDEDALELANFGVIKRSLVTEVLVLNDLRGPTKLREGSVRYNTVKKTAFGIEELEDPQAFFANRKSIFALSHPSLMSQIGWFSGDTRTVVLTSEKANDSYDDRLDYESENVKNNADDIIFRLAHGINCLRAFGIYHGFIYKETVRIRKDKNGKYVPKIMCYGVCDYTKRKFEYDMKDDDDIFNIVCKKLNPEIFHNKRVKVEDIINMKYPLKLKGGTKEEMDEALPKQEYIDELKKKFPDDIFLKNAGTYKSPDIEEESDHRYNGKYFLINNEYVENRGGQLSYCRLDEYLTGNKYQYALAIKSPAINVDEFFVKNDILFNMNFPFLCKYKHYFERNDTLYIIFDGYDGKIEYRKKAAPFIYEMAGALLYLHQHGLKYGLLSIETARTGKLEKNSDFFVFRGHFFGLLELVNKQKGSIKLDVSDALVVFNEFMPKVFKNVSSLKLEDVINMKYNIGKVPSNIVTKVKSYLDLEKLEQEDAVNNDDLEAIDKDKMDKFEAIPQYSEMATRAWEQGQAEEKKDSINNVCNAIKAYNEAYEQGYYPAVKYVHTNKFNWLQITYDEHENMMKNYLNIPFLCDKLRFKVMTLGKIDKPIIHGLSWLGHKCFDDQYVKPHYYEAIDLIKVAAGHFYLDEFNSDLKWLLDKCKDFSKTNTNSELVEFFRKASDDQAKLLYAQMLFFGLFEQTDPEKAISLLRSIRNNCPEASHILGLISIFGVMPKYKEAKKFFLEAANKDFTASYGFLGFINMFEERKVELDILKKGVELNDPVSMVLLSFVSTNTEERFELMSRAAETGQGYACYLFGKALYFGKYSPKHQLASKEWFVRAQDAGIKEASFFLSIIPKLPSKNYIMKLEQSEKPKDVLLLGQHYENGDFVAQSFERAFELYEMAYKAKIGHGYYGRMFEYGKGVVIDVEKAIEIYNEGVKANDTMSMCQLALIYERGKSVKTDKAQAIELYQAAIEKGDNRARYLLADMTENEGKINEAKEMYQEAKEKGSLFAELALARYHDYDHPSAQDNLCPFDEFNSNYMMSYFNIFNGREISRYNYESVELPLINKVCEKGLPMAWILYGSAIQALQPDLQFACQGTFYRNLAKEAFEAENNSFDFLFNDGKGPFYLKKFLKKSAKTAIQQKLSAYAPKVEISDKNMMQYPISPLFKAVEAKDLMMFCALNILEDSSILYLNASTKFTFSLDLMKKAAEKGDPDANYMLGMMYHHGKEVPQDSEEAKKYLNIATNLGHKRAVLILSALGEDVAELVANTMDDEEGVNDINKEGVFIHATNLFWGKGVPQDREAAKKEYLKLLNANDDAARFMLATCYDLKIKNNPLKIRYDETKAFEEPMSLENNEESFCCSCIRETKEKYESVSGYVDIIHRLYEIFPLILSVIRIIQACSLTVASPEVSPFAQEIEKLYRWTGEIVQIILNGLKLEPLTNEQIALTMSIVFVALFSMVTFSLSKGFINFLLMLVGSIIYIPIGLCFGMMTTTGYIIGGIFLFFELIYYPLMVFLYNRSRSKILIPFVWISNIFGLFFFLQYIGLGIPLSQNSGANLKKYFPLADMLSETKLMKNLFFEKMKMYVIQSKIYIDWAIPNYIFAFTVPLIIVDLLVLMVLGLSTIYYFVTACLILIFIINLIIPLTKKFILRRLINFVSINIIYAYIVFGQLLLFPAVDLLTAGENNISNIAIVAVSVFSIILPFMSIVLTCVGMMVMRRWSHPAYQYGWMNAVNSISVKICDGYKIRHFYWPIVDYVYHIVYSISAAFGTPVSNIVLNVIYFVIVWIARPNLYYSDVFLVSGEPFILTIFNALIITHGENQPMKWWMGAMIIGFAFMPAVATLVIWWFYENDKEMDRIHKDIRHEIKRKQEKNISLDMINFEVAEQSSFYKIYPNAEQARFKFLQHYCEIEPEEIEEFISPGYFNKFFDITSLNVANYLNFFVLTIGTVLIYAIIADYMIK